MVTIILVVLLVFAIAGGAPVWPYNNSWGWSPVGVVVLLLLVLLVIGRI